LAGEEVEKPLGNAFFGEDQSDIKINDSGLDLKSFVLDMSFVADCPRSYSS
jgi:hypothetical protein